jgi:hypothetical protein
MIICGFDQAVKGTGWAYGPPGDVPVRGWQEFPDYGDNTARLGKYVRQWAITFLKSTGAERVYFEQVLVRKVGFHMPTLQKQLKVQGSLETAAEMVGLEDHAYEALIADWRREFHHGLRPGKNAESESAAWKVLAVKECASRGWWTEDHNIAEACGVWHYGCLCEDKVYRARAKLSDRRAQSAADDARRAAL